MWLSAIKISRLQAGSKIYANKSEDENGNVRCTINAC